MNEPLVSVPLSEIASEVLVEELQRRGGYRISEDNGRGWTTSRAASIALGFAPTWLSKILGQGIQPPGLELERSNRSGRVRAVRYAEEFRTWAQSRRQVQLKAT